MISNTPPSDMSIALYRRLLRTAQKIAAEKDVYRLCEMILAEAQDITGADGGTFYLVRQDKNGRDDHLDFVIVRNTSLGIGTTNHTRQQNTFPALPLFEQSDNDFT